jgi:multiple sugar transport system substrate-binding protein
MQMKGMECMRKTGWKNVAHIAIIVLVLSLVMGCSGNKGSSDANSSTTGSSATTADNTDNNGASPVSEKPQEVVLWSQDWGNEYNKIFDSAVEKFFTPTHPDIKLKITHMKIDEKLLPAVASGKVPDITYLNSAMAIPFALNGALQPLDDFMKEINVNPVNDFTAAINASYSWDGKLYAVGFSADSLALFWNKEAFKDAGLDPEKGPTTLEQISEFNRKLLKKDANGKLQRIGLNFLNSTYPYYTVGVATGSTWFDKQNNKATVNDDATVKAYQYILDETKAIGINELNKFIGGFGTGNNDPFYTGKAAMVIDGYWKFLDAKQFAPNLQYGVVPLPKSFAGMSWGYGIPTGAKNKEGAQQFLKWMLTDKVAAQFMAEGTNVFNYKPATEEWFKSLAQISKGTPNEKYLDVWKDVIEKSQENTYISPAPAAYDQWLAKALTDVVENKKSPKQALDEANQQIQSEIDKALSSAKK